MKSFYETRQALGGAVELSLIGDESAFGPSFLSQLWRIVFEFERKFSRFLPASELSIFNRGAGHTQKISGEFKDILLATKNLSEQTEGLYNPFILPALQKAGYRQSMMPGYENDYQEDYSSRSITGIDQLEIKGDFAKIPSNTAIDLGGIGKGYLADALAEKAGKSFHGYWFSIGGDIAFGGVNEQGKPWEAGIQNAQHPEKTIAYTEPISGDFGVATSGTIKRKGMDKNGSWHHIIDTRTLRPAETDVMTATVIHESAMKADVLASCAVILGSDAAFDFLKARGAKGALLQCRRLEEFFTLEFGQINAHKAQGIEV